MVYKFGGEGKNKAFTSFSLAPHKLHSGAVRGLKEMLR
jgi:hypothetical protein